MNVTVLGATEGIGQRVVEALLAAGHRVTVVVSQPDRLRPEARRKVHVVRGELTDDDAVERAITTAKVVVWAVGPAVNAPDQPALFASAARTLVEAMNRKGVRRLIALSGAGVTMPGERKPIAGRVISRLAALTSRHVIAAWEAERDAFTSTGLEWTLVRPPRVVDGDAHSRSNLSDRLRVSRVTEGDVAKAITSLVGREGRKHIDRAPYVG